MATESLELGLRNYELTLYSLIHVQVAGSIRPKINCLFGVTLPTVTFLTFPDQT